MPPPTFPGESDSNGLVDQAEAPPVGLEERARAWQLTGDPARLWPDLDPRDLQPAATAIELSAAAILAGRRWSLGDPDGSDASAIGIAALVTGTGPLLGYWIEQELLEVRGPLRQILARHLVHGRWRMGRVTRAVAPALSALIAAGVTPTIIKGFHTAHVHFPEAGVRPLADVDVVVLPEEVALAEGVLRAQGFSPDAMVERPYKREWFPPDTDRRVWSLEFWHARSPLRLELHDAPSFNQFILHRVTLAHPARHAVPWEILGLKVRVPAPPLLVALLATHLSGELYSMRLLRLIELILVIRREGAGVDWPQVEAILERSAAMRFAYPAFALAERLAPGTIDATVLARARGASTRLGRQVVDRFTPTSPILQERVSLAERLMWASGPMDVLRRLAMMVRPPGKVSLRQLIRVYHARLRRAVTGRVSWE